MARQQNNSRLETFWSVQLILKRSEDTYVSEEEDHGYSYTTTNEIWSRDLVTNETSKEQ